MASPVRIRNPLSPQTTERPNLRVVTARRQFAWFAMAVIVVAAAMLMGATYLHTQLADRQLEIDALDRRLRTAQEEFDVLRAERAVLRSPTRLADEASALGMASVDPNSSTCSASTTASAISSCTAKRSVNSRSKVSE